ncbi:hypothetical protein PAXRUDRAFT_158252 [Paxillus rubicundulus Ve08.2h10]|uniref:Uncharacterized protein n=1 Tax=Paxillus rubicundulus Ve08.2h10 TaxID=930991 RepID=A0A0D0DP52_9AGAM|nr:hypothetical protein PAXRUDRAFT_158252 [Paxillus rubicundulus Ve08.2h10]
MNQLCTLCSLGVSLNTAHCHGIIITQIKHHIPHIFTEILGADKSTFHCSNLWVWDFLFHNMRWSMHKSTQVAQKLPQNVEEVCQKQFLRLALTIHDYVIHSPSFYINIDQRNVVYQPPSSSTYDGIGAK